jgi:tetratricopeptide (TPR) repeat protein
MRELLQNLFGGKTKQGSDPALDGMPSNTPQSLEYQIEQADRLWQNGQVAEAIVLYRRAIKQNPQSTQTYEHLYGLLKQHENIAEGYAKIATDLKQQGQVDRAASCYRQAIDLKTLTLDAKERLLADKNGSFPVDRTSEIADIKDTAFSFQPLTKNSAIKPHNPSDKNPQIELTNFTQNLTKIEWETAHIYIQQALDYYDKKEWEQTIVSCQKAIQVIPTMAEAYKIWGNALQRLGQTAEAMKCYDKAAEIQPDWAEIYAGIGKLYALQQNWQVAIKYYQKAIIIKPNFPVAYRNLATIWMQLGQPERAKINNYHAEKLETKSEVKAKISSVKSPLVIEQAIEKSITKAITKSDLHPIETYRQLAQNLEKQHKWQEAAICYRKALDLKLSQQIPAEKPVPIPLTRLHAPTEFDKLPPAPVNKSLPPQPITKQPLKFLEEENQLDKAIRRYYRQVQLNPDSSKIRTDLGNLYARKKSWDLAIDCYLQAIEINSQDYRAYLNLARVYARSGKQAEFIEYISLALAIKPNVASAVDYFYLGNAWFEREQFDRAISSYQQAIALKPNYAEAYHHLGSVLSQLGKPDKAIEYYQKAIECNPQDTTFYYSLGSELENQKRWDGAVRAYSRVLELEPRFPDASRKLNYALSKKIEFELASKKISNVN